MNKKKIYSLAEIGVFTALFAVISQISIPMPFFVPLTLQVISISLAAYTLGVKKSLVAILVYVVLGAVGVPVFASFGSSFATLFGYTGGFIWGFFPLALFCALGKGKMKILFSAIGLILCHLVGVLWYSFVSKIDIFTSFVTMSLPYLFKDAILILLAYFLSKIIKKRIKKS